MKLYLAVGVLAAALFSVVGFVAYKGPVIDLNESKPIPVRYMPNEQLARELSPVRRFSGPQVLHVPAGFRCYSADMQRYRRVVIVCTAA